MQTTIIGIITGILAGFIASKLQSGNGKGLLLDLFLGIVGSLFGSWLFSLLGIQANGWIGQLICAVVGAIIILWVVSKLK
ncbi:MAG: GlsB/YeaQ/YmgE family stress response membrane protein [Bacteroidaceae bacterium]|nr:GlsB/YeaQ/YmgE family stress response membrane protein [Bacteroidaceae bacterium]MBQ8454760.1 GlsB/YeaQ/YmgE family stress response membrane protein [Bacteroidaceae bacterium]MBQ9170568.1 GlsB/YeaQ/YmgE family stress response membrane protein [Bacteroidaceae bacterium]MBQ9295484.1 GlsB/YeaQ/YmgE family stress response membrane protein [Bacteroidaceae bacterium]